MTSERTRGRRRELFTICLSGEKHHAVATFSYDEAITCFLCKKILYLSARLETLIELMMVQGATPRSTEGLLAECAKAEITLQLEHEFDMAAHPCGVGRSAESSGEIPENSISSQ